MSALITNNSNNQDRDRDETRNIRSQVHRIYFPNTHSTTGIRPKTTATQIRSGQRETSQSKTEDSEIAIPNVDEPQRPRTKSIPNNVEETKLLTRFYKCAKGLIINMARSYNLDFDDCLQDCFLQVHKLNDEEKQSEALIYVVCKRHMIRLVKQSTRIRQHEVQTGQWEDFDVEDKSMPLNVQFDTELTLLLRQVHLSERSMKILYLRYYCDLTLQKIGNYLHLTKERIRQELLNLQKLLREADKETLKDE